MAEFLITFGGKLLDFANLAGLAFIISPFIPGQKFKLGLFLSSITIYMVLTVASYVCIREGSRRKEVK